MTRMSIPIIGVLTLALCTTGLWAEDGAWKAPSFRARKKNPVAVDAQSIAAGKTLYIQECISCHGSAGKGDGPAASDLVKAATDLSSPVVADQSDGALFWKISTGRSPMPTFKDLATDEQRWQVVNYMRTLATGTIVVPPKYDAPPALRSALTNVISAYFQLSNSLASDDVEPAKAAWGDLTKRIDALKDIDSEPWDETINQAWQQRYQSLKTAAERVRDTQTDDKQALRISLNILSPAIMDAVADFGHSLAEPVKRFHCAMAFENKGADWLQADSDINNPYLGDPRTKCGSITRAYAAIRDPE